MINYFNWERATLPENAITELIKSQPQLEKLMMPFFYAKHWEKALFDNPKYLLQRDGRRFSFIENTRALVAADFLMFSDNGLDSLCNMFYKKIEQQKSDPDGIFKDVTECDAATWLIYNQIDSNNGRKYLKRQLQLKNWNFIENIYDLAAEEIIDVLGEENLPFLITLDACDNLFYKFVNSEFLRKNYKNGEDELFSFFQPDNIIFTIADENGNTLLHAALLYAIYADIYSVIDTSNQYYARYNYLIEQGCNPDKKNNLGFSCNDLIADIKTRIRELERSC